MRVFIVGCYGHTMVLTGNVGTISINSTQYQNWMSCYWRIRVGTTGVSSTIGIITIRVRRDNTPM